MLITGLLGLFNCLSVLRKACTSAKVSIAKTVRLSMEEAETLLKADSKFKVIHLVRDPRGVLKSRQISGISWTYRMTTEQFCSTVLQDVNVRACVCFVVDIILKILKYQQLFSGEV